MRPPRSARSSVTRTITLAFGVVLLLSLLTECMSAWLSTQVEAAHREAQAATLLLVRLNELRFEMEERGVAVRARLLSRSADADAEEQARRATVGMLLERVEASVTTDDGRRLIAQVRQSEADYTAGVERVLSASGSQADALRAFQQEVPLLRTKLSRACDALLAASVDEVKVLLARADQSAARARTLSYLSTALALGLGALVVQRLTREVDRRFGQEERALHLRDEFLSAASHELKTPLTTLTLQLESLNRALGTESASNPRVTRAMEKMRTQTRRLVQLIESLLDVSRLQAGRLPLERRQVDLVTLVREAAAELDPQFTQAGVPLRLEAAGPVVGEFDPLRLHLVVTNLLSNAVKYGGGSPVDVTVAHVEGAALLRVADAGPGIAPEDQQRIFERFERASHMGGTGVGLWLVRELVGAHGGRVLLESAPGRGASFTITLPLTSPPHALPR